MAAAQPEAVVRRRLSLLLVVLVALPLTGCWDTIELNDRGIVSTLGVDRDPENGQLTVWAQILQPTQLGGPGSAEIRSIVLDGQGRTIEEALISLQDKYTPRIYMGHLHWVVLSERFAKGGVLEVIDWLNHSPDRRLSILLLVTPGSVHEYLKLTSNFAMRAMAVVRDAIGNEIGGSSSLLAWGADLTAAGRDPVMGSFQPVYQNGKLNTDVATSTGIVLFRDDRMVKRLDPKESVPFLLLNGDLLGGTSAQSYEGPGPLKRAVITWRGAKVERNVALKNGRIQYQVTFVIEGRLSELDVDSPLMDREWVPLVEREIGKLLAERMKRVFADLQATGVDSVGVGQLVHGRLPDYWAKVAPNWQEQHYPKVELVVTPKVTVASQGILRKAIKPEKNGKEPFGPGRP